MPKMVHLYSTNQIVTKVIKKVFKNLTKRLESTYRFCNGNINEFYLMLQEGGYLYEYMDDWVKFNGTSLKVRRKSFTRVLKSFKNI